uniref:RNA helicase n=1 Tax=Aceria tosichella TaxID=561515 RepID=A0A6G1SBT2_9ACAR
MSKETNYQLAHDLSDTSKLRSADVALSESVTFDEFLLSFETLEGLRRCGFNRPSPIQLETIPLGLCGFDLVVQSKAGTGKTCIFALVAIESLKFNSTKCTQSLILAPTREVAIQIHEVVSLIGSCHPELSCALCIGGVDVKQDRVQLINKDCQIVIGTPGRVKQLIELNILKVQQIELFVLDEADKLMDEQFKLQIDEIYKRLPADKQMIVTSATYPNELSHFLQKYMTSPKTIRLGKELRLEAIEELYVESKAGHSTKKSFDNKIIDLLKILKQTDFYKCIIFTNFQARAPMICDNLNKDENYLQAYGQSSYICAELSQSDRCRVFETFKKSDQQQVMVSTDISARGIDIQDIDLVINFDIPNDNSTYYHRIGRAGRFGQPGKAITIVSSDAFDRGSFEQHVISDKINKITL